MLEIAQGACGNRRGGDAHDTGQSELFTCVISNFYRVALHFALPWIVHNLYVDQAVLPPFRWPHRYVHRKVPGKRTSVQGSLRELREVMLLFLSQDMALRSSFGARALGRA